MSNLFESTDRFLATGVPKASKFQKIVRFFNKHVWNRGGKSQDPGNYEHWAESIKYDDGGDGTSVYAKIKEQLNTSLADEKCSTIIISRLPDQISTKYVFRGSYDFACDGYNDEAQIQQAYNIISEVGYGKIFLRKGKYNIESSMNFPFPPSGKESSSFSMMIQGEEGTIIKQKSTHLHQPAAFMLTLNAHTCFDRPTMLIFKNLIFETDFSWSGPTSPPVLVSSLIDLEDTSSTAFHIIFDNCGFIISDEYFVNRLGWVAINLIGTSRLGNVTFNECYFKRRYLSYDGLYLEGAQNHLGNIIKAEKLNSIIIKDCIFEDRGARHEFDPFIYTTPEDR